MGARRILVVEDDAAIRVGVSDALRFEGYEPVVAATFEEARRSGVRGVVDLVLLDLVLPGGTGSRSCARLPRRAAYPARHHPDRARPRSATACAAWTWARTTTSSNRSA